MRKKKQEEDLMPGTLDILILKSLTRGPLHGYDVAERIYSASDEVLRVEEGALYQSLHRLELRGLLDSHWGLSDNNRRAKFYKLTTEGRNHLESVGSRWSRVSAAVSRVMRTA